MGPLGGECGPDQDRGASGGRRRLAAHPGPDAIQVRPGYGATASCPSRRLLPVPVFCRDLVPLSQVVLWVALPRGNGVRVLGNLGRYTFGRNFQLPRALDLTLRTLKYLLLAFFLYAVANMSAAAIAQFLASPYALIVDVRMLNFFRYLGTTAALVILGLVLASIFVQNFWCRFLCPYGALMGGWLRCLARFA